MPQVGSQVLKFRHSLFYFRRIGETGSDAPPDPGRAARRRQLTRQLRDYRRILSSHMTLAIPAARTREARNGSPLSILNNLIPSVASLPFWSRTDRQTGDAKI